MPMAKAHNFADIEHSPTKDIVGMSILDVDNICQVSLKSVKHNGRSLLHKFV